MDFGGEHQQRYLPSVHWLNLFSSTLSYNSFSPLFYTGELLWQKLHCTWFPSLFMLPPHAAHSAEERGLLAINCSSEPPRPLQSLQFIQEKGHIVFKILAKIWEKWTAHICGRSVAKMALKGRLVWLYLPKAGGALNTTLTICLSQIRIYQHTTIQTEDGLNFDCWGSCWPLHSMSLEAENVDGYLSNTVILHWWLD